MPGPGAGPLHFLTTTVSLLQLRAWTAPLTRTVIWDLPCTTRSQAQSNLCRHSHLFMAPQRLDLWASPETLLALLAAVAAAARQQPLRPTSCALPLPPSSVAPTQNPSRRVSWSRQRCTELEMPKLSTPL